MLNYLMALMLNFSPLGLFNKNAKILFLGLDNAGKTSLLYVLKEDRVQSHTPTIHPNTSELIMENLNIKVFDLGGHEAARRLWEDYFATVDAIIYLVDASDTGRFPEAAKELKNLLSSEELQDIPFLILGNKIDSPQAVSTEHLKYSLGLMDVLDSKPEVELFMCSVIRRMGYGDGFKWLAEVLNDKISILPKSVTTLWGGQNQE